MTINNAEKRRWYERLGKFVASTPHANKRNMTRLAWA